MSRLDKVKELATMIGAGLYNPTAIPLIREQARNRYNSKSAHYAIPALDRAFDKRVNELRPGAEVAYDLTTAIPQGTVRERVNQVIERPTVYAGSTAPGESPGISINPTSDRALFAHELGHLASQQTDIGNMVASLRHNPKLKQALMGAMLTVPGFAAALEEGDDDLDSSLAIAALTAAPTMIDEGLATKNALAMMDSAGMRATLGQRGKLAGGLLSYMAAPVLAATAGNAVGNLMD